MYRIADGGRVLQLDGPEFSQPIEPAQKSLSTAVVRSVSRPRTKKSTSIPPTENDPPDVVLHSDGCAIALHLSVLQDRCPALYKKLRQLRHQSESKIEAISLKLLEDEELRKRKDKAKDSSKCPLRDTQSVGLDYTLNAEE
ncbi:hypothetical protein PHMEG_00014523 [Phytophthora megakarya]|uniref:Uncharacterized protein n=1 Tax=Phytophthora megakarya TaxID=4795 RepID=A0A225W444_9STRA|nr:hypothetical protein PHMEG_00014523 [Phytophthora megakarya]